MAGGRSPLWDLTNFIALRMTPSFLAAALRDNFLGETGHTSAVCAGEPQRRHLLRWQGQLASVWPAWPHEKQWPAAMSFQDARLPERSGAERL